MSNHKLLIVIVALAFIAVGSWLVISLSLQNNKLAEVKELPISFAVENITAFNVDTDAVYLGSVHRGSSARRKVHLSVEEDRVVSIIIIGNISPLLTISDNNFLMTPENPRPVLISAFAPLDAEIPTHYTGTLRFLFFEP